MNAPDEWDARERALLGLALGVHARELAPTLGMSERGVWEFAEREEEAILRLRRALTSTAYGRVLAAADAACAMLARSVDPRDMAPAERLALSKASSTALRLLLDMRGAAYADAQLAELARVIEETGMSDTRSAGGS